MRKKQKVFQAFTMVIQFGLNMIVPIVMCTLFGVWIGEKYHMPAITVLLFLMGSVAGFRNIFIMAKKSIRMKIKRIRIEGTAMFRRLNEALPELLLGILLYGIVIQLTGVWFVKDQLRYSSGLWIGILTAMAMAYHIARIIAETVDFIDPEKARGRIIAKGIARYIAVVIVFTVTMYFDLGNLVTLFIGVMGLKISAYLQPALHKVLKKVTGKGGGSSDETNTVEREVKM